MTSVDDRARSRPYLLPQGVILRAIAYLIDAFLVAAAAFALFTIAGAEAPAPPSVVDWTAITDYLATDFGFRLQLASQVGLVVYGALGEALWGRTLGKYVLGLEVARAADGAGCDWRGAIIRNLLKPIDLMFAGMPGALVVMVTRRRQRLGDLAGSTLVVRRLPVLPSFAGMPMPGVLKRCEGCGGLVEAAGGCPNCAQPATAADVPQPMAAMMAVGQAAAGVSSATREFLVAEVEFRRASSEEYERIEASAPGAAGAPLGVRVGSTNEPTAPDAELGDGQPADADAGVEPSGAEPPHVEPPGAEPADAEAELVRTQPADADAEPVESDGETEAGADEEEYSVEYTTAWSAFLESARMLHRRYALFEEAARQAGLRVDQAVGMQPDLASWVDELGGYLVAEDDEAVFEAFSSRALAPPE